MLDEIIEYHKNYEEKHIQILATENIEAKQSRFRFSGTSLIIVFNGTYVSIDPYFRGHMG